MTLRFQDTRPVSHLSLRISEDRGDWQQQHQSPIQQYLFKSDLSFESKFITPLATGPASRLQNIPTSRLIERSKTTSPRSLLLTWIANMTLYYSLVSNFSCFPHLLLHLRALPRPFLSNHTNEHNAFSCLCSGLYPTTILMAVHIN